MTDLNCYLQMLLRAGLEPHIDCRDDGHVRVLVAPEERGQSFNTDYAACLVFRGGKLVAAGACV